MLILKAWFKGIYIGGVIFESHQVKDSMFLSIREGSNRAKELGSG